MKPTRKTTINPRFCIRFERGNEVAGTNEWLMDHGGQIMETKPYRCPHLIGLTLDMEKIMGLADLYAGKVTSVCVKAPYPGVILFWGWGKFSDLLCILEKKPDI